MPMQENLDNVLTLFFNSPDRNFYLREIARMTGLSAPGVKKILRKLKKEGFLVSSREKVVENYRATKNDKFIICKRAHNLISLFESGLVDFLRSAYEEPEAIVVFGSYARGEDAEASDIDMAVVTEKELHLNLKRFEKALARRINVYEIKVEKCKSEFLNNLANGAVLHGYLEVIR